MAGERKSSEAPSTASRAEVEFDSGGDRCAAWLYRPASEEGSDGGRTPAAGAAAGEDASAPGAPLVILAHGFGMTREAGLAAYAERFAAAGIAALVFDYRHFGASGGRPRELLEIGRQLDDWRAAIAYARGLAWADPERIALWGTSFSGGHVVAVAAEDERIATVVSQAPFSGTGERQGPPRPAFMARLIFAAVRDELASRLGRGPAYLPVTDAPGEPCLFEVPPADDPLAALLPEGGHGWRNRFTPRVILRLRGYRPFERVGRIRRPWLLCVCDRDSVTPAQRAVERAMPSSGLVLRRYPIEHFQIYSGEWFERAAAEQAEFLCEQLG